MANADKHASRGEPPGWALDRAREELYDVDDRATITKRAWEIARDVKERADERHDEYDDPDQGGEA